MEKEMHKSPVRVSVIIPSYGSSREGVLQRLLEDLKNQSYKDFEVLVIKGQGRQGRAINKGASLSKGEILVIMDDDSIPGHKDMIKNLVDVLETRSDVGMVGASPIEPPNLPWIQRKIYFELPRKKFNIVEGIVDSDMAQHGCCAIPKKVFEEVGGENEEIIRGLDPYLRQKIVKAGYRVVLAPKTWFYHPFPDTFSGLLKMYFRNGKGSAFCYVNYPDLIYDTMDDGTSSQYIKKNTLLYRVLRKSYVLFIAIIRFKFIRVIAILSYGLGYIYGFLCYKIKRVKSKSK